MFKYVVKNYTLFSNFIKEVYFYIILKTLNSSNKKGLRKINFPGLPNNMSIYPL